MIYFGKYSWTLIVCLKKKKPEYIIIDVSLDHIFRESAEGRYVPNAGFLEDVVFEDPSLSSCQNSDSPEVSAATSIDQLNITKNHDREESLDSSDIQADSSASSTRPIDDGNNGANDITAAVSDLKLPDTGFTHEPNDQHSLSTEDIDSLLDKCLLQALHTTVKEKDLPMPGSTLWWDRQSLSFPPLLPFSLSLSPAHTHTHTHTSLSLS